MCGICGIADWRGREIDTDLVLRMRDVMTSRGPDDAGLHEEPGVVLGHRRLSIIDLSTDGRQPMSDEKGATWVVFNGEIYNFQPLRTQLVGKGHRFRSHTDTEIIVHGYEEWGVDGLAKRILGMFAIAIWDAAGRKLHLLRDHVGKKPLLYSFSEGRLAFGSDIKCLWLADGERPRIDPHALDEYLYYYFITQERSIYQGISKVRPGHRLTFDADGCCCQRFWNPDYSTKIVRSVDDYLDGIEHYLGQAVRRRLVSDVPLGAFLSGGVDSSAVCAMMARECPAGPKTFSVAFPDVPSYNESRYAKSVAAHIGSEHRELEARTDLLAELPRIVWHYGEPFGDSSALPTYLIAQAAREHVSVVLTGDGGDEAFAGYDRYVTAGRDRRVGWLPKWLRQGLLPACGNLLSQAMPASLLAQRILVFARYAAGMREAVAGNICWWDSVRHRLYTPAWRKRVGEWNPIRAQTEILRDLTGQTQVDRALEYVLRVRLPSDYLAKIDVATMAHSLEARSPFLDVDLLEFAASIPVDILLDGKTTKALLKRYAERLLPAEVIHRPKQGFALPVGHWLRTTHRGLVEGLLLSSPSCERGIFSPEVVRSIWDEHRTGKHDHTHRLWALVVFEVWQRLFVDRSLQPDEPLVIR